MLHHKTGEAVNAIEKSQLDTLNQRKSFVHKLAEQFNDVDYWQDTEEISSCTQDGIHTAC